MKGKATSRRNSWQEKGSTYMILHLFCTRGRNQFIILRTVRNIKILIFPLPNWVYYCLCQMCLQDHSRPLSTKILQNNVIIKNYSFYNAHFWEISNMWLPLYYLTYVDCVKNRTQKSWRRRLKQWKLLLSSFPVHKIQKSTCTLLFGLVAFPNSLWNIL